MDQNDRDDIDESPASMSLEDLIVEAERSGSFEDFLNSKTVVKGGKWTQTTATSTPPTSGASDAGQSSGSSSSAKDEASSSEASNVPTATDLRIAVVNDPNYIKNGFVKSHQDQHAEGEVPEPAIKDIPEPPKPPVEEAQIAVTEVTVHHHPIVGFYSSSNTHRVEEDDEMRAMHLNAYNEGVSKMTPERIQEVIRNMERASVLNNRAQQGFREALEVHLLKLNTNQREELREKDRIARAKLKPRPEGATKRSKPSGGKAVGVASTDKKAIDALFKMGFEKDEAIARLKKDGKDVNADMLAYVEKTWASGVAS